MADPTRFDIYCKGGGRWQRLASFDGRDREAALTAAETYDGDADFDGVRVMAVTEFSTGRAPLETLEWISPHLSKVTPAGQRRKRRVASAPAGADTAPPPPSQAAQPAAAGVVAATARRRTRDESNPVAQIVRLGLAFGGALLAASLLQPATQIVFRLAAGFGLETGSATRATAALLFSSLGFFAVLAYALKHVPAPAARRKVPTAPRAAGAETAPLRAAAAAPSEPETPAPTEEPAAPVGPAKPTVGVSEDNRRAILRFLEIVLSHAAAAIPRLEQYVMFGIHLFLAGAARGLGARRGLTEMQRFVLIRECVEGIGTGPEQVDQFCRSFFEYLADSRYRRMVDVGEQAMARYLDGDEERALRLFLEALRDWSDDAQARAMSQGIVAIMFTDLVGSTKMTLERGDWGAQEVVRVHNAIVRTALAEFQGREVKHTGDGIMASFTSAPRAVLAAMAIQRLLERNNASRSNPPVHVRIGINAGDAIREEDDYFGHTVQMSARVCDKADAGEVYVTDNVRELCRSHDIDFDDAGRFELKGLPDPVPLHEVRWQAAPAPAAP